MLARRYRQWVAVAVTLTGCTSWQIPVAEHLISVEHKLQQRWSMLSNLPRDPQFRFS